MDVDNIMFNFLYFSIMTNLTKNFTLEELTKRSTASAKGIKNTPTAIHKAELMKLCKDVLQKIRDKYGKPIIVTSGYRSQDLNNALAKAGYTVSKTSQHMRGQAADIIASDGDNAALFNLIKGMIDKKEITVGQLIWEKGNKKQPRWIHVSTPYSKTNNILYLF